MTRTNEIVRFSEQENCLICLYFYFVKSISFMHMLDKHEKGVRNSRPELSMSKPDDKLIFHPNRTST